MQEPADSSTSSSPASSSAAPYRHLSVAAPTWGVRSAFAVAEPEPEPVTVWTNGDETLVRVLVDPE
ncbi:MAG TPA: hypothetical protein VGL20_13385 [Candidatus Dormibacteraeota bacterium]